MSTGKVFSMELYIRFRDFDALKHINSSVFFTYFEEGRKRFFREVFKEPQPDYFCYTMAHTSCDFHKPVSLSDELILKIWVSGIRTSSFDLSYQVADKKDRSVIYTSGKSVLVNLDPDEQRSVKIAPRLRNQLSTYMAK